MGKKTKSDYAVIDIETVNWTRYYLGGLYDGENYFFHKKIDGLVTEIDNVFRAGKKIIYAHNGGKFDFKILLPLLEEKFFIDIALIQSRIIFITVFEKDENRKKIGVLCDSYNFLRGSLDTLSKKLIGKSKTELPYDKIESVSKKILENYLKNDLLLLYECIEVFFSATQKKLTIASIAMAEFFKNYGGDKINFSNKGTHLEDVIRDNYYFGGRVELYKKSVSGKKIYYYDVNSLYPHVMAENYYPCGRIYETRLYDADKLGFYEIVLETSYQPKISILPYRFNNSIYYVAGETGNIFFVTNNEINLLKKQGVKFSILRGYVFTEKKLMFSEYVANLYAKRMNAGELGIIYKLLLNSLYGKFAMKRKRDIIRNYSTKEVVRSYDTAGVYCIEETELKRAKIYPEISAYVTSYARCYMEKLFSVINYDVIYTDTDSIITEKTFPPEYISADLGKLKLEGVFKEFCGIAPKCYALRGGSDVEEKIVFKGFASSNFTFNDFLNYQKTGKPLVEKREVLRGGIKNIFAILEVEKRTRVNFDKYDYEKNSPLFIRGIKNEKQT